MKRSLLLLSTLLCGSLFAQERDVISDRVPDKFEHREPRGDFFLAQKNPPPGPGIRTGAAPAAGVRVQPPPPNQPPGAPSVPPDPFDRAPAPASVPAPAGYGQRLAGIVQRHPGTPAAPFEEGAKRTLIVGFDKKDASVRQNIQEDMQIMSRLLDKATGRALESSQDRRMGIVVMTLPGTRGENIFIEDYGPLFILNVPIPLSGPRRADSEESEKPDSDWEQTKRELYQNRPFGTFEPMKYDARKVEALKEAVFEALKNAANIRNLEPHHTVTVVITGSENAPGIIKRISKKSDSDSGREERREEVFEHKVPAPQPTSLTIRVKKSDADTFASGKMKADEFAKKAMVTTE